MTVAPLLSLHVTELRTAVLSRCTANSLSACFKIRSAGVSREDLTDRYIPAVARELGNEWSEDLIGFAETTVGASRLQWLLRALEPPAPDPAKVADGPGVLVLVPAGEHHTIGAILLSTQLRRHGFCVNLMLEATAEDIVTRMREASLQSTMISTSPGPHLHDLPALVAASRRVMDPDAPVFVGGIAAGAVPNLKLLSGADHVTTDLNEALRWFSVRIGEEDGAACQ